MNFLTSSHHIVFTLTQHYQLDCLVDQVHLLITFFASLLLASLMYHPVFSQVEYLIISLIVLALMSHVQLLTLLNISMLCK